VVSASLFIRAGLFLSLLANHGPFGFDPSTFTGPFLTFISFAQYLVPLAILELYFRVRQRSGAFGRMAIAVLLFVLTLGMAGGVFGVTASIWAPAVKAALDGRKSIAETLSRTIAMNGIDAAVGQYHQLKAEAWAGAYNFDEAELNSLGYELLRARRSKDAIRIFELNIEAYPNSANVYDSLGEGYANDRALAIANYQKSLELNAKNHNAVVMLEKLGVR